MKNMGTSAVIITLTIILSAVLIVRTLKCREYFYEEVLPPDLPVDAGTAAQHLSEAVQIKTITFDETSMNGSGDFERFADFLERSYPGVQRVMTREVINGFSLLYRWHGRMSGQKPVLFCAHIDVVPVEPGTESLWEYPPFSGAIEGGAVWGRGTLDIKNQIIAIMEAAELLIALGFVPERDIYFAFGHDEEIRGHDGADAIAAGLKERGIIFEYVLDEGGNVIDNAVPGVRRPVAFIGIAEKGFVNVHLAAGGESGHSSMPPEHTATGIVCLAVSRIESKRFPLRITMPVKLMIRAIAPAAGPGTRLILANMWLFAPVFKRIFAGSHSGNAQLRTTTAATMIAGSSAPNVLPRNAGAVVNARILHGETSGSLKSRIAKAVNDRSVSIDLRQVYEPSKISPVDSYGFRRAAGIIRKLWPEAVIAPCLVAGGTDGRKYEELTDCVYRFTPVRLDESEMKQVHGTNEHISLKNLEDSIRFYTAMFAG